MYNRRIFAEDGHTYKKRMYLERRRNRRSNYCNYNSYESQSNIQVQECKVNHQESMDNQEGTLIKPRKFMLKYTR